MRATARMTVGAREGARSRPAIVAVLIGLTIAVGLCGSASAAVTHKFIEGIGGAETPAEFMLPFGIAVDNSSSVSAGDLYATAFVSSTVNRFGLSGGKYVYGCQITGAGQASVSPSECDKSQPGAPGGTFSFPFASAVAVDGSGDVFVGDTDPGVNVLYEFDAAGRYVSQVALEGAPLAMAATQAGEVLIAARSVVYRYDPATSKLGVFASGTPAGAFGSAEGVAVDGDPSSPSVGRVYVADASSHAVDVFDSSGKYLSSLTGTPAGAFPTVHEDAVDPSTGDLYVTAGRVVDQFDPAGGFLGTVETPGAEQFSSVAVNGVTGEVFAAVFGEGVVDRFGPGVTVPDVSLGAVSGVGITAVTVSGTVGPAGSGEVASCQFEYGTSPGVFGNTVPCTPGAPFSTPTEVTAAIGGLTADTPYYYRLVAGNANGTNHIEGTFETAGKPTVAEQSATHVRQDSAVVQAKVNPHGFATTYQVEYGETEAYGSKLPVSPASAGSGLTPQAVSVEVPGLKLDTEYHYRFVATNEQGVVEGTDATFTTKTVASVENQMWLAGPREVTLKARIEDYGAPSECEVEIVTDAAFQAGGYTTPTIALCTPQQVAGKEEALYAIARPHGLAANTTYHFRFLLSNEYGEVRSDDQTFATFGFSSFTMTATESEGQPSRQAGGHPYVLNTDIQLNTTTAQDGTEGPSGTIRDINVHLPAGMTGNPEAVAKCTRYDSEHLRCAGATQVGLLTVVFLPEHPGQPPLQELVPLYNLVAPRGVAAELGARVNNFANAFIDGGVRTGSDYGIDADSLRIPTLAGILGVHVQVWGVPASAVHDAQRGCGTGFGYAKPCSANEIARPFLTNPTSCTGAPLTAAVEGDTYQAPGEFVSLGTELPSLTGCEAVPFTPSITVTPESSAADSPTGLHVDLHVPQNEDPSRLAEADLKDATVTLPQGFTVNPATAGGVIGCSEAQLELHGREPARCPDESKIGTVALTSPLVDHPLKGSVYLAQQGNAGPAQGSNPFGSLAALYIAIDDEETGVVIKLAGKVSINPANGQLTTTFDENPQLPFEDLKLDLYGGPRAPLATPTVCGAYTASASLASWAEPGSPVDPYLAPFQVSTGPVGGPCPSGVFNPSFEAGTTGAQAGAFAPFVLKLSRHDGEQEMRDLEQTLPAGVSAKLAGVPQCGNTEAARGACPAASEIGTVDVTAGVGTTPIPVKGRVFLTGPYNNGPFGEVVEIPAIAGPFNLDEGGKPVTVRGSIRINPSTAQATVVSDPFPTILQGIRLKVRTVKVTLDRPGFTFNPTNCTPQAVTGVAEGAEGAKSALSSPFNVANCATLPFKPVFRASTSGHASRANGTAFDVKVTSHGGPQQGGGEANIAKVKVTLPKSLPTRDSTLKKACPAATFEHNPTACPAAATVGTATVNTPVLAKPLSGPAILVSHANAAFPDLDIVLQGEGVTLTLVGNTDITKGITTSTFNSVPDAPISSFELKLPAGPYGILGAYAPGADHNLLCGKTLNMPTTITAQNGAVLNQTTRIAETGCATGKTAAQKLAAALTACHRKRAAGVRAACARIARRRYGRSTH